MSIKEKIRKIIYNLLGDELNRLNDRIDKLENNRLLIDNMQSIDQCEKSDVNVYGGIDYFDFENYFRGSTQHVKKTQEQYLKYFVNHQNVVDLGCGRGEFLDLLKDNCIDSQGVDLYREFVEMCNVKGLHVTIGDAIEFLKKQDKVGGIFASQLIEHLPFNQVVDLCNIAYDKLEGGASIIMETPNPTSLAIYTQFFYIDPSHQKPVHPMTMKYLLEKAGFSKIDIIYTENSKLPVNVPNIRGIDGDEELNSFLNRIAELMFGSQDYAIIATK